MVSVNTLRKIDPSVKDFTDHEIEAIRDSFYELGQLMFEDWKEAKHVSKSPVGSLTSLDNKNTL